MAGTKMSESYDISQTSLSAKPLKVDKSDYAWITHLSDMSGLAIAVFSESRGLEYFNDRTSELFEIAKDAFDYEPSYADIIEHMAKRGDFGSGDSQSFITHIADIFNNQREGDGDIAEIKVTMPSGRRLLVRQKHITDDLTLLTAKDITLEEHKSHTLDIALESGSAGFWYYNCETKEFSFTSEYLENQLSFRQLERARDKGVMAIIHPDDLAMAKAVWEQALSTGKPWKHTCRILTGNGQSMWLRWNARPQLSEKGHLISFTSFFHDITQELETSDALRKAKEAAENSLKTQNDFLARLSHEIRTPMNGVIGIADALIHHHADNEINSKLELIQSSAEKILRIMDETLNHTKLHADKFKLESAPASPAKSVENVVRLWEHKALKNNISLSYNIDSSVPDMIVFDSLRYEQCLNNLISNAIKFTPNGTVKVILTTVVSEDGSARLVLAVKDNGIGMATDQQKQIFDPYTQADTSIARRFGGTGLGMTITKEIIELMGGAVSLRSESGKGSVFVITLPFEINEEDRDLNNTSSGVLVTQILEDAKPDPTNYSDLRVLVVDDNATNHMVITSLLNSLVGEILTAHDGQQAINILETTEVDLVLMDIHMPVMDGIEATLAIRGRSEPWADIKIIALTADPQYQQKRLCRNIGMDEALAKPVKLVELLEAFDSVLTPENHSQKFQKSA